MMQKLKALHDEMLSGGITFSFTGYMSEDVVLGVGKTLKTKFEIDQLDRKTSSGMFSIFVEMVQNVVRYSAECHGDDDDVQEPPIVDLRYGVLSIGKQQDRNFVACGNLIEDRHVQRLGEKLRHIQGLTPPELKKLFKESLKGEVPEGSKGAGVGFIEIARRAKLGFDFAFEPADRDRQFFTITAYL